MHEEVEGWIEEVLENGTFKSEEDVIEFCIYGIKTFGEMFGLSFSEEGQLQTLGGQYPLLNEMTKEDRERFEEEYGEDVEMTPHPVKLDDYKKRFDNLKILAESWKAKSWKDLEGEWEEEQEDDVSITDIMIKDEEEIEVEIKEEEDVPMDWDVGFKQREPPLDKEAAALKAQTPFQTFEAGITKEGLEELREEIDEILTEKKEVK